jgi:signal transduction histidine kinase
MKTMPKLLNRLGAKLIFAILIFLLILGTATAAVITAGFRQAQQNATQHSIQGLQNKGRETLLQITQREAQISDADLQQARETALIAAKYFVNVHREQHNAADWSLERLAVTPGGSRFDPDPLRRSEIWIDPTVELNPQIEENLRASSLLEALFPAVISHDPDTMSIYFMDPYGATRYYPVIELAELLTPELVILEGDFFRMAAPVENPQRQPVWTPPYLDDVGLGPVVTASVPVYADDLFLGVMSVDISLSRLIERLNGLTPTPGSYAMLIDSEGHLVAAPPEALTSLLKGSAVEHVVTNALTSGSDTAAFLTQTFGLSLDLVENQAFSQTLLDMQRGATGLAQFSLHGVPVYLAYAPLPNVNWSLAVIAPISELTTESAAVARAIGNDATTTIRWTLVIISIFFAFALFGTIVFARNFLTIPIEGMVAATRKIAAGHFDVTLPVHSGDELGQLAESVNQMNTQLIQAQQGLEVRVADRTRHLAALFDVTTVASRSLDLQTVLNSSLDRVLEMIGCQSGCVHLVDEDKKVMQLATYRYIPEVIVAHIQTVPIDRGLVGWVMVNGEPLVAENLAEDPRVINRDAMQIGSGRGFAGVPLRAKNKILGVLSVIGEEGRSFNAEEVALLSAIAEQVGVAVENASLYQQAEQLAVIEERQRLARELHDSITQSLYSVNLMTETARRTAATGDIERTQYLVARSSEIARQALKEMRLLVYELRPAALTQEGLVGAIQQRLDTVESRAGVQARLLVEGSSDELPPAVEANFYRIAQEALNNSLKHANASQVTVTLYFNQNTVELHISDDGQGFDPSDTQDKGGIGLKSMRERTEQMGGSFKINTVLEQGTNVIVSLPWNGQERAVEERIL